MDKHGLKVKTDDDGGDDVDTGPEINGEMLCTQTKPIVSGN